MTRGAVVVVGPATVCGPGVVDAESVTAALACLDDEIGLVANRVQDAGEIWRAVLAAAAGPSPTALTVVYPSHFSAARMNRIRAAARTVAPQVVFVDRRDALRQKAGRPDSAVVEVGEDLVVVATTNRPAVVHARSSPALAQLVVRSLGDESGAIIDLPSGIAGAGRLAADIASAAARRGTTMTTLGCADLCRSAEDAPHERHWNTRVLVAGGVVVAACLAVLAVRTVPGPGHVAASAAADTTWLVEGRVSMQVPARWRIERAVSDSGSARVEVISPDDPGRVIHLTQSSVPPDTDLGASARVLRAAAAKAGPGVIVDFADDDAAAGRAAVTYREVRAGREVRWAVLLDGTVRIAVGCQGPTIAADCDRAIRSAHRIGENLSAGGGTDRPSGASNQQMSPKDGPTKGTP